MNDPYFSNEPVQPDSQAANTSPAHFLIDYLAVNFPLDITLPQVKALLGIEHVVSRPDSPVRGYVQVHRNGSLAIHTHETGYLRLELKGTGLHNLAERGVVQDWCAWLGQILELGGRVRRLDVALDDHSGLLSLESIRERIALGLCTSRMQRNEHIGDADGSPRITLCWGSPSSDVRIRIYDKARKEGVPGPWLRVEPQLRDDSAHRVVQAMVQAESQRSGSALGVVRAFVHRRLQFKEPNAGDRNRARWPTWQPWAQFLAHDGTAPLQLNPRPERTLADRMAWMKHQYGPTFRAAVAVYGVEAVLAQLMRVE